MCAALGGGEGRGPSSSSQKTLPRALNILHENKKIMAIRWPSVGKALAPIAYLLHLAPTTANALRHDEGPVELWAPTAASGKRRVPPPFGSMPPPCWRASPFQTLLLRPFFALGAWDKGRLWVDPSFSSPPLSSSIPCLVSFLSRTVTVFLKAQIL